MRDLIDRADAIAVAQYGKDVEKGIEALPIVDAVEVVRCWACPYFAEANINSKGFLICPASGMEITGMDYCSYGERKE